MYVAGLVLFTVASAACALAPDMRLLIAARAAQGIGAAIIAAAVGARFGLDESYGPRSRLDVPGLVLVSAGAAALIWALVHGSQTGWTSGQEALAVSLGAVLMVAFVAWEKRANEPMIPLGLFRSLTFSGAVGATFLLAASVYSAAFLISQFFQFALDESPLNTGLRFLPWTATPLLVAPAAGALSDRVGARALMIPGLLMQGAGLAWIVALAGSHSGYGGYVAPFMLAGIGVSMAIPSSSAAALNAAPPEALGKASAIVNTLRQFGAVFGIAIVTAVFSSKGSLSGPAAVTSGYRPALAVAAGFSVLGAVVSLAVRRRVASRSTDSPTVPDPTQPGRRLEVSHALAAD